MAHRVATEYVNASITLTEAEMPTLLSLCETQLLKLQVFVLDNGNQEIVLEDDTGKETIRLSFERVSGRYRCVLSCRIVQPKLTNALRKIVSVFKGDAVVNRIYEGFTMVYHYMAGAVIRIVECKGADCRTVFEYTDALGLLEQRFKLHTVEEEIFKIRAAVNDLLDRRNRAGSTESVREIDECLKYHSRLLFALEA